MCVVLDGDSLQFPIKRHGCDVRVTLEIYEDGDAKVCGLRFIEGAMPIGPRALLAAVHAELPIIERIAREAGCTEMRHAGDDRAIFLPGYEPMAGGRNMRRKGLLDGK